MARCGRPPGPSKGSLPSLIQSHVGDPEDLSRSDSRLSISLRTRSARSTAPPRSIANSSDEEDSDGEGEYIEPTSAGTRVLKEVSIPRMAPSSTKKRSSLLKGSSADSPLTISPFDSTADNSSVECDTSRTSVSTTPAAPSGRKAKSALAGPSNAAKKRARSSRLAAIVVDSDIEMFDTAGDAELAKALQEEEYGTAPSILPTAGPSSQSGKTRKHIDLTSDDDTLSVLSIASSESFEPPARKRAKLTGSRRAIQGLNDTLSDKDSGVDSDDDSAFARKISRLVAAGEDETDEDSEDEDSEENVPLVSVSRSKRPAVRGRFRRSNKQNARLGKLPQSVQNRIAQAHDRGERRRIRDRGYLEMAHPEITNMWENLEAIPIIKPEQAQQPAAITQKLKSFQLEGLSWMTKQEKTQYKGGLLGDEMGMGKTIQAVSLIMSDYPAKDPTLVVVPPVALMQWSNEIGEYTNGKLKVLVYHGTNAKCKKMTTKELRKFDVIMISYNSLESLYRKETKGWSRGENIVKEDSPIHAITFHRLILDEAHSIKSRTTGVAKACFALKGKYKWCLSGTPVQNRIGEFFSLLRFLEVRPFADYFCRRCNCAQLHWSLNADYMCSHCNHSGAEHVSVFNQELLNPITGDNEAKRSEALDKLHMITARIMLRRMKRDHTSSMELPPKEVIIHNEFFGEIERDFSSSIMSNTARQFDTYVSRGVMLNNYANIFGLIMQMRQVADHPDLLLKKSAEGGQNILVCQICDEPAEEAIRSRCRHEFCRSCVKNYVQSVEGSGGTADCPRCHIPLSIDFDQPDIEQDEEVVKKNSIINRIKMENWTSSTKIEMLVYDLYKLRSKKQTLKSIVFSQFTSMLQLIEWRLRRAGFNTVMLDGSMTPAQRQKSIEYFMNNSDVEVFLVSLKAGGVALNLTEASRVFIVDPWWNPAAEWQSADRCHRIGQKRPCVITRLCIEDSVESRMVMLQEKKASMISGTINNDKVAMDKLSPEDLQFLFRGT